MSDWFLQWQAGETGSHEAALAFVVVWVFETQSLFGAVLLQVRQLLAVDGAPAFPVGGINTKYPLVVFGFLINDFSIYNNSNNNDIKCT